MEWTFNVFLTLTLSFEIDQRDNTFEIVHLYTYPKLANHANNLQIAIYNSFLTIKSELLFYLLATLFDYVAV